MIDFIIVQVLNYCFGEQNEPNCLKIAFRLSVVLKTSVTKFTQIYIYLRIKKMLYQNSTSTTMLSEIK